MAFREIVNGRYCLSDVNIAAALTIENMVIRGGVVDPDQEKPLPAIEYDFPYVKIVTRRKRRPRKKPLPGARVDAAGGDKSLPGPPVVRSWIGPT